MSRLKWNIAANYCGKFWTAGLNLLSVPVYVRLLGVEAFGLVGFFTVLTAAFQILDIGLYTTMSRELARTGKHEDSSGATRDLVRTLETIVWTIAGFAALTAWTIAPYLSEHWLNPESLTKATVGNSIALMGVAMAVGHPYTLYNGGLLGLERQVLVNWINIVFTTVRCGGAILVLMFVSATPEAFFIWQIPLFFARTIVTAIFMKRSLPASTKPPRFRFTYIKDLWRFSLGVSGGALLAILLMQVDKVVLSHILTLEMFGYYSLAWILAFNLAGLVVEPLRDAAFPRMSYHVYKAEERDLTDLYHLICQASSALLSAVTVVGLLFAHPILLVWTGNECTTCETCSLLQFLIVGNALRVLMIIPTAVQLAYGWTRLTLMLNLFATLVFIPLVMILAQEKGACGAAASWVILYSGYVVAGVALMHKRILKGEQKSWYALDCGLPFGTSLAVGSVFYAAAPDDLSVVPMIAYLGIATSVSLASSAYAAPRTRQWINSHVVARFLWAYAALRYSPGQPFHRQGGKNS